MKKASDTLKRMVDKIDKYKWVVTNYNFTGAKKQHKICAVDTDDNVVKIIGYVESGLSDALFICMMHNEADDIIEGINEEVITKDKPLAKWQPLLIGLSIPVGLFLGYLIYT